MKPLLRFAGARIEPVPSLAVAADMLWTVLRAWRADLPRGARLFVLEAGGRRASLLTPAQLGNTLLRSGPSRPSERSPGVPPYRAVVIAADGADILRIAAGFSTETAPRAPGAQLELAAAERLFSGRGDAPAFAQRLLESMVRTMNLSAARAVPGAATARPELPVRARVGWLTFLPDRLGPLPALPPRASAARADGHGWVLCTYPELPSPATEAHAEALAHLRHALGARVLLDGPSFPHAAPGPPALEAPAQAPAPELASYMKAPPPMAAGPSVTEQPPAAAQVSPLSTETANIDVSKIRRPAVPFAPEGPPARPAAVPAAAAPARPRTGMSTETTAVDVAKILGSVVPFDARGAPAAPPGPRTEPFPAAAAAPPPGAPSRRLVRFDPQTGEPLAQPRWEEVPAAAGPEKKP